MKVKNILCMIIALAMAIVFLCQEPMRVLANSETANTYLKDIKLLTDTTKAEAEKWFKDNGYILSDTQFVKDSFGDSAYLGYKTTSNKNEAVTDMRIMNMLGGYDIVDFNEKIEDKFTASFTEGATKFKNAFTEFKKNVEADEAGTAKSPLTKAGKELLNQLTYKDTPLYNYLVSSTCTLDDCKRIIAVTTTETLSYIFFCMMLGVYYNASIDFQAELDKNTLFAVKPTDDYGALDVSFYDDAKDLYTSFKQFAELYALAKENYDEDVKTIKSLDNTTKADADTLLDKTTTPSSNGGTGLVIINDDESNKLDLPYASDKSSASGSAISQVSSMAQVDALKSDEDAAASHIYALNAYDILSKYTITSDYAENLGEYIIKSASMENEDEGVRMLYPLIDMLTPSQLLALKSVGIQTFVLFLDKNTEDTYKIFHDKLTEVSDGNTFSIFTDVDTDLYDKTCAYTDEAFRKDAAGKRYEDEAKGHLSDNENTAIQMKKVLSITVMACGSLVVAGSVLIALGGGSLTSAFSLAIAAISFMHLCGAVAAAGVALVVGGAFIALAAVAVVAIVVILIVWLVNEFSEDEPDPIERTEIPEIMYEYESSADIYVKYEVLYDPVAKEPVDIANEKGTEWDAIYYTHSKKCGSPIVIKDNKLFTENLLNSSVDKMMPLVRFSDTLLAGDVKRCYGTSFIHLYLYYYTEDSLAGKSGGTVTTNGVYISDVKIADGDSQNAGKDHLMGQGFTVIDQDLTPNVKGKWTYLGYKTTNDVNSALRDIRVGFNINTKKNEYSFGKASYGCSGTLTTGASVHMTSSEYAGTPIVANAGLIIVDDRSKAPAGYEPVSLFCGGDAFDFCFCVDQTENWDKHLYIYYKPSTTYTSGTEYISGLATVNARTVNSYTVGDYILACGFKNIFPDYYYEDVNLFYLRTGGNDFNLTDEDGLYEDYITRMVYSTTYNPYRAITDIQIMEYSCTMPMACSSVCYGGNNYSVCESFQQGMLEYGRTIRNDKSYIPTTKNGTDWYGDADYAKRGYKSNEGDGEGSFARNLYVTGCTGDTPIKSDDIVFCKNADTPEELVKQNPALGDASDWQGVHEFGHPYDSDASNLYHTIYYYFDKLWWEPYTATVDYHFNMYIKRKTPERPKYVKSIVVCSDKKEDSSTNDVARIDAMSASVGELIEYNFAETSTNQWRTVSYSMIDGDDKRHYNINRYKKNGNSSYLYVTYTNDKLEAIREIRLVKKDDEESPKIGSKLNYQVWDYKKNEKAKSRYSKDEDSYATVPFTCCGDVISTTGIENAGLGSYYIYTSTNSFFGSPITDVYFNGNKLDIDAETACWFDDSLINIPTEYYFHAKRETTAKDARYASDVEIYNGNTKQDCLDKLYDAGCDRVLNYNFSTDGKYCYLGYKEHTTALYNYVLTGLRMSSTVADLDVTAMSDMDLYQYSLNEEEEIKSTYTCLNSDGSMGSVNITFEAPESENSTYTVTKTEKRYRYLYGTYDEKLCSGLMMNTLTVKEGTDATPDITDLDGYEGLITGVGKGEIKIKNKKANTSIKNLYNLYQYGTSWSSQYVQVRNLVENSPACWTKDIGCSKGMACMWYKSAETFNNKTFTGDIGALFDTVYTDDTSMTIYPKVNSTDNKMSGKYILFNNYTTESTLTVPNGENVGIFMRGNSITCKGSSTFVVEKGGTLTLTGDKTKKGGIYTYSTASDHSGLPKSCITVNGKLTATNVNFDPTTRCDAVDVGAYSAIDYSGEAMTLTNCKFTNSYGWMIYGSVYAHSGKKITLTGCTFDDVLIGWDYGGVNLIGTDADITNCTFTKLDGCVGGALNIENATVNVKNCTIGNCKATGHSGHGGGIYAYKSTLNLTDTNITGCFAKEQGGGMYVGNTKCTIKNCNFTSNTSDWQGGGIFAYESELSIEGGSISSNKTGELGGGLVVSNLNCTIKDCDITSNTSDTLGGGIYALSSELEIEDSDVSSNSSSQGGGLYASQTKCKMTNCDFTLNNGKCQGGGIFAYSSEIDFTDGSISSNKSSEGGGMLISGSSSKLTLTDTEITGNKATTSYGGVYVFNCISGIDLNGVVKIKLNGSNDKASNLCLPKGQMVNASNLDFDSSIGVMSTSDEDEIRLTTTGVYSPMLYRFTSDSSDYKVGIHRGYSWLALVKKTSMAAIPGKKYNFSNYQSEKPEFNDNDNTIPPENNNDSVKPRVNNDSSTSSVSTDSPSALASIIGKGNIWLIVIGFVALALTLGVLVIVNQKKKSKSTDDTTDNE